MEILLYNGISAKTTIEILKDAEYSLGVIGRMHTYSGDEENNNFEKIGIDEDKKTLKFIIDNFKNYKLINDNNYRKDLIVGLEDKIDELSKNRRLHYSLYGIKLLDEFIIENNI